MVIKEIMRFNEAIRHDEELQNRIKVIGADLEEIVRFANQKGFDFTVDDLKKAQDGDIELCDEELESVAGGIVGAIVAQTITVVGLAIVCN